MRLAIVLSTVSCLIFSTSIAITRQEEGNAETAFKNIQSFKGKKASDVISAMQFMSASLKVDCQYCHTQDFSSDEKGEKKTTRRMIAMQNDINEHNFGGRPQVTCATCHAGHTHPVSFPPVEGIEVRARRSKDVTAEGIMALFAKAVGSEASKPLPPMHWEGFQDGAEKLKAETDFADGKFFLTVHNPKGDTKIGYDGTKVWYYQGKEGQALPPSVAEEFINQLKLLVSPESLSKLTNPSPGTAKIGTRDMLVLTGTLGESKVRASIFFDKQTGLPARAAYYYPTILGSMAQINDYSDYKKINGYQLPTTIANHSSNEDSVRHYKSIKMNAKIDPAIFNEPKTEK